MGIYLSKYLQMLLAVSDGDIQSSHHELGDTKQRLSHTFNLTKPEKMTTKPITLHSLLMIETCLIRFRLCLPFLGQGQGHGHQLIQWESEEE